MSSFMLVRHKVRDFADWKPVYDGHQPTRKKAGVSARHVFRSADDPNNVFVLFEVEDVNRAKAFGTSADLRETMMRAGVADQPDIYFLNDAGK